MTPLDIRKNHGHLWIEIALHSLGSFEPISVGPRTDLGAFGPISGGPRPVYDNL